jgi:hypothetical protein
MRITNKYGLPMVKIIDGEYKTKTISGKYDNSDIRYKEVIKYRKVDIDGYYKIEEGQTIRYYEKEEGKEEYKPAQQHLIGYTYLSLIDKSKNEDVIWIQGNKEYKKWMIAKSKYFKDWEWKSKDEVIKEFLRLLEEEYQVKLVIKNSEIL